MVFNIDFEKLVLWLIPTFLRKPIIYAYVKALVNPAAQLHQEFLNNWESNLYKLSHNSQVFSIESVLNDKFDPVERRIYITNGFTKDRIYAYTRTELKPVYLPIPLFNRGDYADTGVDFIVWIPNVVAMNTESLIEAKASVNFYKRGSKRFKIYRV
ncbi:MAG: hypothetical protein IE931_03295 [Sphingobacteriales bacterium]|nr:hypothetical protein [Sphingobacteriales bacterium]